MNKVLNGFNDPQVIKGIKTTMGRSSHGTDEPLLFIEAESGDRDSQLLSCAADVENWLGIQYFHLISEMPILLYIELLTRIL